MNRWRVFNLLSIVAGMIAASLWATILLALVEAPFWTQLIIGYLIGRVTIHLARDYLLPP